MAIEEGWDGATARGRSSWVSVRKDSRQLQTEDDEIDNFEVESAMLAPLAEMPVHNHGRDGGGRVRAATKRRRAMYAALAGFVLAMFLYASEGGAVSYRWAAANNACQHLRFESTEGNSVREWAKWAAAVSRVYLQHNVLSLPDVSKEPAIVEAATECAAQGWTKACTEEIFRHNARVRTQLEQIERDRKLLEEEYSTSVAGAGLLPLNQEVRFPAGLGLEYMKAESNAELGVCEMAPKDLDCIQARQEEVETIEVLHAQLHKQVRNVMTVSGGLVGNMQEPSQNVAQGVPILRKLASLIHVQKAPDMMSQAGWRTLNAVSAVVLKQTLERVQADADEDFHDIMLHHDSPAILYIGAFKGLKFHGLGCLYYKDGSLAYEGSWRNGLMDGEGTLFSAQGESLWNGQFVRGEPVRPWYSL